MAIPWFPTMLSSNSPSGWPSDTIQAWPSSISADLWTYVSCLTQMHAFSPSPCLPLHYTCWLSQITPPQRHQNTALSWTLHFSRCFSLLFLTLTIFIFLKFLSYQATHIHSEPFCLLTLFTDNKNAMYWSLNATKEHYKYNGQPVSNMHSNDKRAI